MSGPATGCLERPLAEFDPEIAEVLRGELTSQQQTLEMIATGNFVPRAVLECQGSVLTTSTPKAIRGGATTATASGPVAPSGWRSSERSGCSAASTLTYDRTLEPRRTPHFTTRLPEPGDRLMGLSLDHGGHLTHGMKLNVSGRLCEVGVRRETGVLDLADVRRIAEDSGRR